MNTVAVTPEIQQFCQSLGLTVTKHLGSGAMGHVFGVKEIDTGKDHAIKIISLGDFPEGEREEYRQRFLREVNVQKSMKHPNIVRVDMGGEKGDKLFMLMEYLPQALSLRDYIKKNPASMRRHQIKILEAIGSAIDYAHELEVVHRDIKPENIMINLDGDPKLTDFGLARTAGSTLTQQGIFLGTPRYASPEQLMARQVGIEADRFSFGVLIFEWIAGINPFAGKTFPQVAQNILKGIHQPFDVSIIGGDPVRWAAFVKTALATEPNLRFNSCAATLKSAKRAILAKSNKSAPKTKAMNHPQPSKGVQWKISPWVIAGLGGGLLIGIIGLAAKIFL